MKALVEAETEAEAGEAEAEAGEEKDKERNRKSNRGDAHEICLNDVFRAQYIRRR